MTRVDLPVSVIATALTLSLFVSECEALPLAETIYMIPPSCAEVRLRDEVWQTDRWSRKDSAIVGFGAADCFSMWLQFDYLSQGPFRVKRSEIGDFHCKAKFYIGDFFNDDLHCGLLASVRFPLGSEVTSGGRWRNLAMGRYELRLGPFARADILNLVFMDVNIFYTFREGKGEDFWGGFYLDMTKKETWDKCFGFNPKADNTFFNAKRLKNDYLTLSAAWDTGYWYPVIPFIEVYSSIRVAKGKGDTADLSIEGGMRTIFLMAAGVRYFVREALFLGFYTIQNPFRARQKEYISSVYGIELSFQM